MRRKVLPMQTVELNGNLNNFVRQNVEIKRSLGCFRHLECFSKKNSVLNTLESFYAFSNIIFIHS